MLVEESDHLVALRDPPVNGEHRHVCLQRLLQLLRDTTGFDPKTKIGTNKAKGKAQVTEVHTNGNTKAKGKAKAAPPRPVSPDANGMDVDEKETEDSDVIPTIRPRSKPPTSVDATAMKREKREIETLGRENERLKKRLEDVFTFQYHPHLSPLSVSYFV